MINRIDYVIARRVGDILIIFYDYQTIYVVYKKSVVIFHRWFVKQRGFYGCNWTKFVDCIKKRKRIGFAKLFSIARQYDVTYQSTTKLPPLKGKKIVIID